MREGEKEKEREREGQADRQADRERLRVRQADRQRRERNRQADRERDRILLSYSDRSIGTSIAFKTLRASSNQREVTISYLVLKFH